MAITISAISRPDSGDTTIDEEIDNPHDEGIPNRRRRVTVIAAALVAVAATAVSIVAGWSWKNAHAVTERDNAVVATASDMAVNLVTLRHDSADADLARVIDGTTGPFREQFTGSADQFGALLSQGAVESTGEVRSAGIVEATDSHAVALAAVTSTVKNNEAPDGEIRVYRMKLTLDHIDDRWMVSNVEFVA